MVLPVSDVGVLWLNAYVDLASFWYEGHHRGQLLYIRWDLDPPVERETSPDLAFAECLHPYTHSTIVLLNVRTVVGNVCLCLQSWSFSSFAELFRALRWLICILNVKTSFCSLGILLTFPKQHLSYDDCL